MTYILILYGFLYHVSYDIGIDHRFLPLSSTQTQGFYEGIALWTDQNLASLKTDKSQYVVHTIKNEKKGFCNIIHIEWRSHIETNLY